MSSTDLSNAADALFSGFPSVFALACSVFNMSWTTPSCFRVHSMWLTIFGRVEVVANAKLRFERRFEIGLRSRRVRVFEHGERLRITLAVDRELDRVFSRHGERPHFRLLFSPVCDGTRFGTAEP